MTWAMVMLGGAIGSALRYGLSLAMNPAVGEGLPWGTLLANVLGCFLIGWAFSWFAPGTELSESARVGILVGLLGGFTTFSSFGLESVALLRAGEVSVLLFYVTASNLAGIAAVWLGLRLA